jgi:AraC-like DNA-binding protein
LIIHHHALPRPPLSAFVEIFWLYEADTPSPPTKERRLPDGSMELVINLRDDLIRAYDRYHHDQCYSYHGGIISGAHSQFALIDTTNQASMVGIHFKPGGASPFLPLPAAELHNQILSLDMLWGIETLDLREQLLTAQTPAQRFHILEQFLLSRLAPSHATHPAISFALKEFLHPSHSPTIAAVTEQIGISQTRFIQLFRETVGLTPKQFCRIFRFQQMLRALESSTPIKWTDLALSCGYFDQAHFIHDFQAFSGMTPGTYLSLRGEHRNHIALPD